MQIIEPYNCFFLDLWFNRHLSVVLKWRHKTNYIFWKLKFNNSLQQKKAAQQMFSFIITLYSMISYTSWSSAQPYFWFIHQKMLVKSLTTSMRNSNGDDWLLNSSLNTTTNMQYTNEGNATHLEEKESSSCGHLCRYCGWCSGQWWGCSWRWSPDSDEHCDAELICHQDWTAIEAHTSLCILSST